MTVELAKTIFTYIIALVVIVGGGLLLIVPSQVPSNELLPFLTGIVGAVIGYIFSERTSAATASRMTGPATDEATHQPDE